VRIRIIWHAGPVFGASIVNWKRPLSWALMCSGAVLLAAGAREILESRLEQAEISDSWKHVAASHEVPRDVSPSLPPAKPILPIHKGDPIARLSIPRLDAGMFVVEGTGKRELRRGPGHLEGTAFPGGRGNCVIAGHRDTHFRILKDVKRGDEIEFDTEQGQKFRYRVTHVFIVSPSDTRTLDPTKNAVLNLVTCYPFYYVGSAPKRFVVHAEAIDAL